MALAGCAALFLLPAGRAKATPLAYASDRNGNFGTIDLGTGAYTLLGPSGLELCGLGELGSTLYGLSCAGTLYQVNPLNGSLTSVGASGLGNSVAVFGSTPTGLFAIDASANFYSISSSAGTASLKGPLGVAFNTPQSLSTNSSTLFFDQAPGNSTESLYTINTGSGSASLVGSSGSSSAFGQDGMVMLGSTLYGVSTGLSTDTINTGTAAITFGPAVVGESARVTGLAPIIQTSAAPEPRTLGLASAAMAILGLLVRRRRVQGS
jgi:hypothetical protein